MRKNRFNLDKLASDLGKPGGGFSASAKSGKEPGKGIMVSRTGSEEVFDKPPTSRDLLNYTKKHARALKSEGAYLGGWEDDGKFYVDVSQRFPHSEEYEDVITGQMRKPAVNYEADQAMYHNRQLAAYDTSSGTFPVSQPRLPLEEFEPNPQYENTNPPRVSRRDASEFIRMPTPGLTLFEAATLNSQEIESRNNEIKSHLDRYGSFLDSTQSRINKRRARIGK